MELRAPIDAALAGQSWPTSSVHKMTARKCIDGMLVTSLNFVRSNNGSGTTTLRLRFVRYSDNKAYIAELNNEHLKLMRCIKNDPAAIEIWLDCTESVIVLDKNCVITFKQFGETVTFILREEFDSMAEEIARLKSEHAAEIDAVRAEYETRIQQYNNWSPLNYDDDDQPRVKKSKTGEVADFTSTGEVADFTSTGEVTDFFINKSISEISPIEFNN